MTATEGAGSEEDISAASAAAPAAVRGEQDNLLFGVNLQQVAR